MDIPHILFSTLSLAVSQFLFELRRERRSQRAESTACANCTSCGNECCA